MKKGFTLIEIMVSVAIIAILATFSISMMLRNRITSNEAVAIASCRTIVAACQSYYAANIPHTYPANLAALGGGIVGAHMQTEPRTPIGLAYAAVAPARPPARRRLPQQPSQVVTGPAYIDDNLAAGRKSGYDFFYTLVTPESFTLYAEPVSPGRTGNRYFYTDETGRITAREGGRAGPGDAPV